MGENCYLLFHIINVEYNWLNEEPINWEEDEEFNKANKFVRTVKTVNDCAERGVALIQGFIDSTTDEELRQDLILAVQKHREDYPVTKMTKKHSTKLCHSQSTTRTNNFTPKRLMLCSSHVIYICYFHCVSYKEI